MPVTNVDGRGNSTVITYDDASAGLFPKQIQRPTTSNGIQHIDYYSYDRNTGALNWHTDENGTSPNDSAHTTHYTYDVMGRVTSIQYPDGGGSTFCYTDIGGPGCLGSSPNTLYTSTVASPDPAVRTVHSYDGWGLQYRSQVLDASGAATTIVDTTHDWAGRVSSVSNPYIGSFMPLNSPPCGNNYTCYTYDALGRKITQLQPDGSAQHWCYDGYGAIGGGLSCLASGFGQTDFWDETGRHTQQWDDRLGRLTQVLDASTLTQYTYDVFSDLVSVNQSHGGTTVSRNFRYDMPSRVMWSCNPEAIGSGQNCPSGTAGTNYVYDGNSNLIQKTDNRGIATNYHYDSLNRLEYKTYSDGTASACFQYDSPSVTNGVGRLGAQWTQNGACNSSSAIQTRTAPTSYDRMGRLITEQRCMGIANCASGGYPMTYSYDLAGKLASYSSGYGGLSFANTYDAAGRLQGVTNPTLGHTLFSSPTYTPAGALKGVQLGSSITMFRTFDPRQRVTSETDYGSGNVGDLPGSASAIIQGAEQHN
jgi:YD repeat-containing protein